MAVRDIIQAAGGSAATDTAVYVEDVFSTYLYTGTGASQTITNGIDLATKGGMVWLKSRSVGGNSAIFDTARGSGNLISSASSGQQNQYGSASSLLSSFNTTGFTLGTDSYFWVNESAQTYASWTFRKQAKFFDVVTYTGNGSARTISHALGATPGMIIVKRTDVTGDWQVYHKSLTSAGYSIQLNLLNAQSSATTVWNSTAPTSSVFSVGTDASVNASGGTYIAYLFADSNSGGFGAAGTDSVVACGSFTGIAQSINLGWEPQFVLCKNRGSSQNWLMFDGMRGFNQSSGNVVNPNTTDAEVNNFPGTFYPTATGFYNDALSGTCIYLAIRRGPMKTPTDATKVFSPSRVNTSAGTKITTGFPVDLQIYAADVRGPNKYFFDRLRGISTNSTDSGAKLDSTNTLAEATTGSGYTRFWDNTGYLQDSTWASKDNSLWNFRRAPGFFDVVCYTGTAATQTINHNLGVVPELWIIKRRDTTGTWYVGTYIPPNPLLYYTTLTNGSSYVQNSNVWTTPTTTTFGIGTAFPTTADFNASGGKYIAYLFASCTGVSKIGTYTGSGTTKQIDCGFAAGARFVMIKRLEANSTYNWFIWDTARGIVSGNDPYLLLNDTAAEVTNTDYIDPYSAGFEISSSAPAAINASGGTFIYLAIA